MHLLKKLNWKSILILIIVLAAIIRFWNLGVLPAGFHEDEAAYGYNAYSILLTGKDEHGISYPMVMKSFGEYKPALYAYITIPWIILFGLEPLSVRMSSALFGLLTVPLLFFLTLKLLKNQNIALVSALLLAISPWHIILSRTTSEVVVSLFFILSLTYCLLALRKQFNYWLFVGAMASGFFAMYSYTASRFFVIIIVLLFTMFSLKKERKAHSVNIPLLFLSSLFICSALLMSYFDSASRFNQISIFSNPETKLILEEQIREDRTTTPLVTRLIHNKVINYERTILKNLGEYFTLNFLALEGGYPYRIRVPDAGLFYLWQIPFLLLGIYVLIRERTRYSILLFGWWILLLIPAALTFHETPNLYRSLVVLPPIIIILAIGIHRFFLSISSHSIMQKGAFLLMTFIILCELLYFGHQYSIHHEVHQPWYRGYAYQPLMQELNNLSPQYDSIVITTSNGGAYISLLFFGAYSPEIYQREGSPGGKGFGKYMFLGKDCPLFAGEKGKDSFSGEPGVLYINKGSCKTPMKNVKEIKTIYWQDGNPAFKLLEFIPPVNMTLPNGYNNNYNNGYNNGYKAN